jgi:hypothetical protein
MKRYTQSLNFGFHVNEVIIRFENLLSINFKQQLNEDICDAEISKDEKGLILLKVTGGLNLELLSKSAKFRVYDEITKSYK